MTLNRFWLVTGMLVLAGIVALVVFLATGGGGGSGGGPGY